MKGDWAANDWPLRLCQFLRLGQNNQCIRQFRFTGVKTPNNQLTKRKGSFELTVLEDLTPDLLSSILGVTHHHRNICQKKKSSGVFHGQEVRAMQQGPIFSFSLQQGHVPNGLKTYCLLGPIS